MRTPPQHGQVTGRLAGTASPVAAKLGSPGRALEPRVRSQMEARLGHDFSRVRIHTDSSASESARAMGALAYSVGEDVVFDQGRYDAGSAAGRHLLMHELAHVIQQTDASATEASEADAEREADAAAADRDDGPMRLSRRPVRPHLQTGSQTGTTGMTRAEFERRLTRLFGVVRVVTGTEAQQASELTPRGGAPPGGIVLPGWQRWDPGAASDFYDEILTAIQDFGAAIGGVPPINEVVFYNVQYEVNQAGVGTPQRDVGASYGAGRLVIYRSATTMDTWLPVARSNVAGRYPQVVIGIGGVRGQTPGAPLPYPTREQSERRVLAHELGHGLAEAAMSADPRTFADFRRAVGWTAAQAPELYDVQAAGVGAALAAGTSPPASARITEDNWNSPSLGEQPLTHYAVSGGPAEDFAESVMALVYAPDLLRARSPARYTFLTSRLARWLPALIQLPQIGDFPLPRGDQRVA